MSVNETPRTPLAAPERAFAEFAVGVEAGQLTDAQLIACVQFYRTRDAARDAACASGLAHYRIVDTYGNDGLFIRPENN